MAVADVISRAKNIIYGTGLGEHPAIRRAAADAGESISGSIVTFNLLSGEGAKVKPGNTLSELGGNRVLYVLSMSTDAVTAVNGHRGSTQVADTDLDGALLEQNPLVTEHELDEAIDTIFANMLWPHVYDVVTATVSSPNLTNGQEAVAAEVEQIISAWQVIGIDKTNIAASSYPVEVHTSVASTGKLASFDWNDGGTGYYTYRAKFTEADEADTELTRLVATGAAALALGGSLSEATLESTKKDNSEAVSQRQAAANALWRDFLTLRQNMSEELSKRLPQQLVVERG